MEIMDSRERSDTRGKTNFHFSKFFTRAKRAGPILSIMQAFASPSAMSCRTCKRGYNAIAQLTYDLFNLAPSKIPPREHSNALEGNF